MEEVALEAARRFGKDVERRRVQAVTASLDKLKGQAGIYQVGLVSWDNDIDFSLPLTANSTLSGPSCGTSIAMVAPI